MMKPDFTKMSPKELKAYVLEHRDDDEAIRAYFHRPGVKWTTMPPLYQDGKPIEENIKLAEETIRRLAEQDRKKEQDRLNDDDESHSE